MTKYDLLLLPENLIYAWQKAKRLYRMADGYVDNGELAEFELNLEKRLGKIQRQFERSSYRMRKLRPVPRPKKLNKGNAIDRQYYHVSVDDQVAWIALVNVLGPGLDRVTPAWNYGNRIYRPAWYEGEGWESSLEIGPYRHASGHLYRKFQHSWPLFRRHVALTAKTMAKAQSLSSDEMDDADRLATATADKENLPYLNGAFWNRPNTGSASNDLFHASIDLKQFYPSIRKQAVINGLEHADGMQDDRIKKLVSEMLKFRIDLSEMPEETLQHVEPGYNTKRAKGLPTGLFVSGFLANAAMLPIDAIVDKKLGTQRSVAHFRFVDDHTFLAYEFDELCEWIDWYRSLLKEHGTGATVNEKKYDPASLNEWMKVRTKQSESPQQKSKRDTAVIDTRIDGTLPTRLLTKTLAQVSAIAATDIEILDDDDLVERLKQLEWLLLADIPEREIRPDTRAAFAAGQIANLAGNLVQETDGLIDEARQLAALRVNAPDRSRSTDADIEKYQTSLREHQSRVDQLQEDHEQAEETHLRRCFGLLLQAFREFPGKSRLFFRLHQYCRVTGFKGIREIEEWIRETRKQGHRRWADYYAGLSLQILAGDLLLAARTLRSDDAMRSESEAAIRHIEDIGTLDDRAFLVPRDRATWFHTVARREFGVALLATAEVVNSTHVGENLGQQLKDLASKCVAVSFDDSGSAWDTETGRRPGVWANLVESVLSVDDIPSPAWNRFQSVLSLAHASDLCAARRYPKGLSDAAWAELLGLKDPLPESDSGWLLEVIESNEDRILAATASRRVAFTRAARSLEKPSTDWLTLAEWTRQLANGCSPFDPRRSEWTALEITRQIAGNLIEGDASHDTQVALDWLHPSNVLVPKSWKNASKFREDATDLSWEKWRTILLEGRQARLRETTNSILDYRYFAGLHTNIPLNGWDRNLAAFGRLILGMLRLDHSAPRVWNIRGNERVFSLPRTRWFQALAISSPTLLLIESCLDRRSSETRAIFRNPKLFGWNDGVEVNDAEFDPPLLQDPNALLNALRNAQRVLQENQLAVALNQPRQVIPFRLADFAAAADDDEKGDDFG